MDIQDFDKDKLSEDQQQQLLFMMLVQQHQQIAMMEIERDLKSAKFAIDTLLMLQKFTEGNLPKELKNYLEQTLSTLRLNYAEEKDEDETAEGEQE